MVHQKSDIPSSPEMILNFGKWLNTCPVKLREISFNDEISSPRGGGQLGMLLLKFQIESLVAMHSWIHLFKTMNLIQIVLSNDKN